MQYVLLKLTRILSGIIITFSAFCFFVGSPLLVDAENLRLPNFLAFGLNVRFLKVVYMLTNTSNLVPFEHWLRCYLKQGCQLAPIYVLDTIEARMVLKELTVRQDILLERTLANAHYRLNRADLAPVTRILCKPFITNQKCLNAYRSLVYLLRPEPLFIMLFFALCSQLLRVEQGVSTIDLGTHYTYILLTLVSMTVLVYYALQQGDI